MEKDSKNMKKISIEVNPNGSIFDNILVYAASFDEIKNYTVERYIKHKESNLYETQLKLSYGESKINFGNHIIDINYSVNDKKPVGLSHSSTCHEKLVVYADKKKILLNFFECARKYVQPKKKGYITTRILRNGYWNQLSKLVKRSVDTVYLDEDNISLISNDIKEFTKNEEEYIKYGIPYKRNYLLYGPPGTGKTSLIFSMASMLNYDIYIVNFTPIIDDIVLMNAISNMDDNSILLLEDIDSLFVRRESSSDNRTTLSFSGLLNILDGIGRKHKLITFITTNHKENLDPALIRAGRIDFQLLFDYASKKQISDMFKSFMGDENTKYLDSFLDSVSHIKTTTAILQKFFFENRNCDNILDKTGVLYDLSCEHNKEHSYTSMYS